MEFRALVLTFATVAPLTVPDGDARFDGSALFEPVSSEVAIPHGPSGAWNGRYTDPGAVVVHDGLLHAFPNGFAAWPAPVGVSHWTSTDSGVTWSSASTDPVFDGTDLPYVGVAALASSAVVLDDGTWVLYFYTWDDPSWPVSGSSIGRATAPGPDGPWTADDELVLIPGPEGAWDAEAVRHPAVVRDDDGLFRLWYTGVGANGAAIGLATSTDGIDWMKHDDPTTTDRAHGDSDPVLEAADDASAWDSGHVHQPRVVAEADGFTMLYTAVESDTRPAAQAHGLAVSADGLTWRRSDVAVVEATEAGGRVIWFTALARVADGYVALLEVGAGGQTEVHVASHHGSIDIDG